MRKGKFVFLGAALLTIVMSITYAYRSQQLMDQSSEAAGNEWKIIGPGAGGGVFIPTISPFDTNLVFSKGDMTGAFVSYDGAKNWKLFNLMSVVQDFEFDPSDSGMIYAASRGYLYDEDRGSGLSMLYRSVNRGRTWKVIYPEIEKMKPLEKLQSNSFLPSGLLKDIPDGSIDIIRVDPSENNNLYLGLSPLRPYIGTIPENIPAMTFLMESKNKGGDWKLLAKIPGTSMLGIFPHCVENEKDEITVVTDEMCVKVNRLTGKISNLKPPYGKFIKAEGGRLSGKSILYVISDLDRDPEGKFAGGVYRSDDGGVNWIEANGDLIRNIPAGNTPIIRAIAVCETRPEIAYLSITTHPKNKIDAKVKVRYEIFRTENSGKSWKTVYSANSVEVLTRNFNDSWLNRNYGPGWGGDILTLGVAPSNPDICYATDFGQAYKTSNGGKTWNQVCSKNNTDSSVTSSGLDLTCCYGVIFDPFDKNHMIISYIDIGLFHSFDGGKSWKQLVTGIPEDWVNTCYHITFDPAVRGKVWSTWANKHSLPRKSQFGDGLFYGYNGGVAFSEDGGRTWQKYNRGLPDNSISTDLLLDPSSPENARILYVSTFNQGIFKSKDGGKSWTSSGKGLKDNCYAWELRMAGKRIYLLCVRGWKGETSLDGSLFYSDDGAENWIEAKLPDGVTAPSDLLIDPDDPRHMFLSCWPKHNDNADICGGVYVTNDGGTSWKQCFDERIRVFAASFDPGNTHRVFINTFQNGAYFSNDRGQSWNRIMGYRFKWGHCPVPDPNTPGMLYLTTYGVSVYYGPATGVSEEFGRIENIPESWW